MKSFKHLLWSGLLGGLAVTAHADERYQAIPISSGSDFGTEKALILDTAAGHMWIWTESPATDSEPGGRYVIYQGQLTPGDQIGDIVLKQEWPVPNVSPIPPPKMTGGLIPYEAPAPRAERACG